ncbi:MAG: DUF2490 domain-containing protein [Cyclobacteriaceae bacterium]|nr:DUF2490 domain-containing protein [Cyclobacteriaceae bacterium]
MSSLCEPVIAQEGKDETGAWMMYFGLNRISEHWSIHSEIQWRNHAVSPNLEQLLLRAGMNYHIANDYLISAGYAYISSHPYDKETSSMIDTEHRLWEQFIVKNSLSRLFFEHRYRYEQRWINGNFRQRLRYRLMISVPLNKRTIEKGSILLAFYDEVFINLEEGNVFDRNRLYGAFGYQFSPVTGIQVGLLEQSVPDYGKFYLQFALFINPDLRKD